MKIQTKEFPDEKYSKQNEQPFIGKNEFSLANYQTLQQQTVPKLKLNIPIDNEQMSKISSRNGPSVNNPKPEKNTVKTLQE